VRGLLGMVVFMDASSCGARVNGDVIKLILGTAKQ
jgi:hypothetical protein